MAAVQHDQKEGGAFAIRLAASIGIDLPEACVDGVVANLLLLREHADRIDGFVLPDDIGAQA